MLRGRATTTRRTSLRQLTKQAWPPSMPEVKTIWSLHRLICKTEGKPFGYQCPCCSPPEVSSLGEQTGWYPLEIPQRMPRARPSIHKAIYRAFTLAAFLSGTYKDPLYHGLAAGWPKDEVTERLLSAACLEQFPILKLINTPYEEDTLFGNAAKWLYDNIMEDIASRDAMADRFDKHIGRATECPGEDECHVHLVDGGTHPDAHLVLWEVLKIFWMWESELMPCPSFKLPPDEILVQMPPTAEMISPIGFSACTVGFTEAEVNKNLYFEAVAILSDEADNCKILSDVNEALLARARVANPTSQLSDQVPTPHTKFFHYFLRRYLGLRFKSGFFDDMDAEISHVEFSYSLYIFALDDVPGRSSLRNSGCTGLNSWIFLDGSEIVDRYDPEGTYDYDIGLLAERRSSTF